jgi:hypothetical protein
MNDANVLKQDSRLHQCVNVDEEENAQNTKFDY